MKVLETMSSMLKLVKMGCMRNIEEKVANTVDEFQILLQESDINANLTVPIKDRLDSALDEIKSATPKWKELWHWNVKKDEQIIGLNPEKINITTWALSNIENIELALKLEGRM